MATDLVLGPMLRRVADDEAAAVWVETTDAATVTIRLVDTDHADGGTWSTPTFAVHGHHDPLVDLTRLAVG